MATYISTIRFSEKGLQAIQDTCKRAESFRTGAGKLGVKVSDIYWTMGAFDGLVIFDAPDEATATAVTLHLASHGDVQTMTSRAFNADEMAKIVAAMPR